jgi:hypothetical protein
LRAPCEHCWTAAESLSARQSAAMSADPTALLAFKHSQLKERVRLPSRMEKSFRHCFFALAFIFSLSNCAGRDGGGVPSPPPFLTRSPCRPSPRHRVSPSSRHRGFVSFHRLRQRASRDATDRFHPPPRFPAAAVAPKHTHSLEASLMVTGFRLGFYASHFF